MAEPIIELGDDVEIDENTSGEPVVRHTPSGAEWRYNSSDDAWTLGTLNPTTISINDVVLAEHVETFTQSGSTSSTVTHTFSGLSAATPYYLKLFGSGGGSTGALNLYFNGDDANDNQNYNHFDESGSSTTGADTIPLFTDTNTGFGRLVGTVEVIGRGTDAAVDNRASSRFKDVTGYTDKGGWEGGSTLSSIKIESELGFNDGTTAELWKGWG